MWLAQSIKSSVIWASCSQIMIICWTSFSFPSPVAMWFVAQLKHTNSLRKTLSLYINCLFSSSLTRFKSDLYISGSMRLSLFCLDLFWWRYDRYEDILLMDFLMSQKWTFIFKQQFFGSHLNPWAGPGVILWAKMHPFIINLCCVFRCRFWSRCRFTFSVTEI